MILASVFKVIATAALGPPFDPVSATSAAAVALAGVVLWAAGTRPRGVRPAGRPCGCRNGTGRSPLAPAPAGPAGAATPLGVLIASNQLLLVAVVAVHALTFVPGVGLPPWWVWPLLLAAVAAPFVAGLVYARAGRAPRSRGEVGDRFWSGRTVGAVLAVLAYAVAVSVATGHGEPARRDAEFVPTDRGRAAPGPTEDESRAALTREVRVVSAASIAWSLWGVLALTELRRLVRRGGEPDRVRVK